MKTTKKKITKIYKTSLNFRKQKYWKQCRKAFMAPFRIFYCRINLPEMKMESGSTYLKYE